MSATTLPAEPLNAGSLNAEALAAAGRRARRRTGGLYAPALLLVGVVLLLPAGALLATSFFGAEGFTLANYARVVGPSYRLTMQTTLVLAVCVTLFCLLLGYPLAYLMTLCGPRIRAALFCCVLFPLWSSVLVRTYAWQVILQRRGILNTLLLQFGLIERPLALANGFGATLVGMTHIMLPMMVLPLFASLAAIDRSLMPAAGSLGASPARAFRDVVVPLSLPGVAVGCILVFVVSLGFYVTPALLGGGRVITWSMRIEQSLSVGSDWGTTSAMGVMLVLAAGGVLLLTAGFGGLRRAVGGER